MLKLIRLLFALIAYLCVATVIALAVGVAYLWQTDRLNQEKAFRMVALLHDIDLQQIAETIRKPDNEVPPEEPSLDDLQHRQQIQDRNFEVKLLALQRGRQQYDYSLQQLKDLIDRYDRLAQDWQSRLKQEKELATQENLAKVVSQLEQVRPDVGKASLMRWIDEGRMDDAIVLMSKMSENKLAKILKTFETDEELDKLHEVHQRIIGGAGTSDLEKALGELNALEAGI